MTGTEIVLAVLVGLILVAVLVLYMIKRRDEKFFQELVGRAAPRKTGNATGSLTVTGPTTLNDPTPASPKVSGATLVEPKRTAVKKSAPPVKKTPAKVVAPKPVKKAPAPKIK